MFGERFVLLRLWFRRICQNSVLKLKFVPDFAMHIGAFVLGTLMLDVIPTAKNRVEH